jgi:hypothetical protein
MTFRRFILLVAGSVFASQGVAAQQPVATERPSLVVNLVMGGIPYDFFTRYGHNLSEGGFRRLMEQGVVFTAARYDYMPTDRASSLATITTGTYPSVHGVVGERWYDVQTGEEVELIADPGATGFGCEYGLGCYSNLNLIAPALGDRLRAESPESRVVSIAADPVSAIVLAGLGTDAYWVNTATAGWTSSSRYMLYLPGWVESFNDQYKGNTYLADWFWALHLAPERYVNRRYARVPLPSGGRFLELPCVGAQSGAAGGGRYAPVVATPLASDLVADFAMQAVVHEALGRDDAPDILNVCFDAPRDIIARYGPESVEAEDMFYQLDRTLGALIGFIVSQVGEERVLFVLTSDHGSSASFDAVGPERERFNGVQFSAIVNSFLCARYEGDRWVTGYSNRRLYFDRREAFERGLSLDEVQRRASDFALQFRGIARVVPSCDLRGGAASDAYMQRLRNGYFPKRSGDLLVDLVPGRIEERAGVRSSAGSAYDYDTHVPLVMAGGGLPHARVEEPVDMASLPVTLARILGIQRPEAATAEALPVVE